jgi:predicted lipoprotein
VRRSLSLALTLAVAAPLLAPCTTPDPEENYLAANTEAPGPGPGSGSGAGAGDEDAGIDFDLDGELPLAQCGRRPVSSGEVSRRALREAASECLLWHHCVMQQRASALQESAEMLAARADAASKTQAREAFAQAMLWWSRLELFQFGPAASPTPAAGRDIYQGQSYRDRIYAWPNVARCRVEQAMVDGSYAEAGFDRVPVSARGLHALDYLLFHDGDDTACAEGSPTQEEWLELDAGAVAEMKRQYAAAVAGNVLSLTRELAERWDPEGDDFREEFVSASAYPNEQEAMNVLGWALSYLDHEGKDWKLGVPAGRVLTSPVTEPESPYAGLGRKALLANIAGFRSLFQGCGEDGEGLGFDDWLIAAGHEDLAQDMLAALDEAEAKIASMPPLHAASTAEIDSAYVTLRVLTDMLKGELLGPASPLNLELPATLEGDTD